MKYNKRVMPVVEYAKRMGYQVTSSRRNQHLKISKDGHQTIFCSATPSDHRAIKNTMAQLRRSFTHPKQA